MNTEFNSMEKFCLLTDHILEVRIGVKNIFHRKILLKKCVEYKLLNKQFNTFLENNKLGQYKEL